VSVAFFWLLAIRTDSEELKFVDYGFEAAVQRNAIVEVCHDTLFNLNYPGTAQTNQMMVVSIIAVRQ
jgi:hypothetical protein